MKTQTTDKLADPKEISGALKTRGWLFRRLMAAAVVTSFVRGAASATQLLVLALLVGVMRVEIALGSVVVAAGQETRRWFGPL